GLRSKRVVSRREMRREQDGLVLAAAFATIPHPRRKVTVTCLLRRVLALMVSRSSIVGIWDTSSACPR
ncbi:MAG: hypothetical protein M3Z66_12100, partial [Chloroflexota bacterium]|nr:hypothetical protein [Chloroflexota bacterium]